VCHACVSASIVGDGGLDPMTPEKYQALDPSTQNALKITLDGLRQMKGNSVGGGGFTN